MRMVGLNEVRYAARDPVAGALARLEAFINNAHERTSAPSL